MEEVEFCDPFDGKKGNYWMKLEHAGRYLFAADFVRQNGLENVADISCANGYGSQLLAKECKLVEGYDVNKKFINQAKSRKIDNANFFCKDFEKEKIADKCFDAVVCFETIEHIKNTQNLMRNLSNCVKKGGYLLLSVPNPKFEQMDEKGKILYKYHKKVFSKQKIKRLLEKYSFDLQQVLGQALVNQIVSKQSLFEKSHQKQNVEEVLLKPDYSSSAISLASRIYAYPDQNSIEESYSFIYICKKI